MLPEELARNISSEQNFGTASPESAVPVAEVAQQAGAGTCCHNNIKNFKVITQPYFTKYVGYLL
jgi:hypothetical protein